MIKSYVVLQEGITSFLDEVSVFAVSARDQQIIVVGLILEDFEFGSLSCNRSPLVSILKLTIYYLQMFYFLDYFLLSR